MRWPGVIRMARDEDGPSIGKLFRSAHHADYGVDWTRPGVSGWWIVAERDGEVRGAIQVVVSKPIGHIGEIVVHPDEQGRASDGRGALGKRLGCLAFNLMVTALAMMTQAGVQIARGTVFDSPHRRALMKVLTRYGGTDSGRFAMFHKRLT